MIQLDKREPVPFFSNPFGLVYENAIKENEVQIHPMTYQLNGIKIQRDLYSAFLIMNIASDFKNFDIDKCNKRFENFYRLHNLEVERLTGHKNLSSIAI